MVRACALTTVDNPFNPFDEFDSWYRFDLDKGYNCCSYLDRIANYSDEMSIIEINRETERAIDEILLFNPTNLYKKVYKDVDEPVYDTSVDDLYEKL